MKSAVHGVNRGYAELQLAKALVTATEHSDPATRARAEERIAKWQAVVAHMLSGPAVYGSRTPLADVPA